MTATVLSLIASVLGFVFWHWKRKASKEDAKTPEEKLKSKQLEIEKAYHEKDEKAIALYLDDALDHIERMQRAKSSDGGKQDNQSAKR